jgi:hypothetical protein
MDVMNKNMKMNAPTTYPPLASPGPAGYPRRLNSAALASAGCALSAILLGLLNLLSQPLYGTVIGSFMGLLFIGAAVAAPILGVVALRDMDRRRERGRGLAIIGLVFGGLFLACVMVTAVAIGLAMSTG